MSDFEVRFAGDTSDLVRELQQLSAAVDRNNANLQSAAAGAGATSQQLEALTQTVRSASDGLVDMNNIAADAASALGVFGLQGLDLEHPLTMVAELAKSSADAFVEYATEVRQLSLTTGMAAEEASALIQASDDVGISADTLAKGFRRLIANGLQPSIETMQELAAEYNAIQDPVERTQFVVERFGAQAGPEMARLLAQGSDAIREMTDEAKELGLTLDEAALQSARNYEIALDNLGDKWDALTMQIGQAVVPALTVLADAGSAAYGAFEDFAIAAAGLSLQISPLMLLFDEQQRATLAAAQATGSLSQYIETVIKVTGLQSAATQTQTELTQGLETATEDLHDAEEERAAAAASAASVWRDAIQALRDSNLATQEKIALETHLRVLSGELTQDQATLSAAINYLTSMYEAGKLTGSEYAAILAEVANTAGGASEQLTVLRDRINEIQSKTVTITYEVRRTGGDPPPGAGEIGIGPDSPKPPPPSQPPPSPDSPPPRDPTKPRMVRSSSSGGTSINIFEAFNTARVRRVVEDVIARTAAVQSARRRMQ